MRVREEKVKIRGKGDKELFSTQRTRVRQRLVAGDYARNMARKKGGAKRFVREKRGGDEK